MNGIVRHNDNRFPRSPEQANATNNALRAQLLAADLTPAMRRAVLAARPTELNQPEWDHVSDYCPGHESLRGDRMGASDYCEGTRVCQQAVDAYRAERTPDPDVLHIRKSDAVKIGTVCALIDRRLVENVPTYDEYGWPQHGLTELGEEVRAHLKAQESAQ